MGFLDGCQHIDTIWIFIEVEPSSDTQPLFRNTVRHARGINPLAWNSKHLMNETQPGATHLKDLIIKNIDLSLFYLMNLYVKKIQ